MHGIFFRGEKKLKRDRIIGHRGNFKCDNEDSGVLKDVYIRVLIYRFIVIWSIPISLFWVDEECTSEMFRQGRKCVYQMS